MHNISRIFVEQNLKKNSNIFISEASKHYIINVMRKNIGDKIILINGKDGEWLGEIIQINKKDCLICLLEQTKQLSLPPKLHLAFGLFKKTEQLIKSSTELGVTDFYPLITERTIIKNVKEEKILTNIKEAVEQSERTDLPTLNSIQKLQNFLNLLPQETCLLFCEERGNNTQNLLQILNENKNKQFCVLIGPEGGFTEKEKEIIKTRQNTFAISLGPRILRTETAANAILAIIQQTIGDWS